MGIADSIDKIRAEKDLSNIGVNKELIDLLSLLERVNPCEQTYEYGENSFVISYMIRLNLLNFKTGIKLFKRVRIVGLPISVDIKGYYGDTSEINQIIAKKKGITIVLNGDKDLGVNTRTLSSFVFENKFENLDSYLDSLRSPYRRRLKKALKYRESLIIRNLKNDEFSDEHYALYRSVAKRSKDPLEILAIDFFKDYDAELFEFRDKSSHKLLAFIQVKVLNEKLYFLFCGFNREDNENNDLYYNMLIKVLEIAFERNIQTVDFGQTSEESKLKIGCREVEKYISIHHSNRIINYILKALSPLFTYQPYGIEHRVFRR
ncbi:MAG: hypothetical protein RBT15_03690 [Gudongella sp.]|jgi:hypothetical protein|nr:hypothetical protein [Gudongella sp.]